MAKELTTTKMVMFMKANGMETRSMVMENIHQTMILTMDNGVEVIKKDKEKLYISQEIYFKAIF